MAAYGLGATRWETMLAVILPTASRGIFGGVVLAFGRALGETMALAMLVGQRQPDQPVAVLAGEHAGGAAGQQFSGGRREAGRRADVRRAGPARHHAGREHRRRGDHPARRPRTRTERHDDGHDSRSSARPIRSRTSTSRSSSDRCAARARCRFPADRRRVGDDAAGACPAVLGGADAAVARRPKAEPGGVHAAAAGAARARRRLRQRHRRHADHRRPRRRGQRADRPADGDLPRPGAREPARDRGAILRQGADRVPVDSRRRVRLRRDRADDRRLLRGRRRGGAVDSDAADDHPDVGRRDPDGAGADARRGHRHGRHPNAGGLDGAAADGDARAF